MLPLADQTALAPLVRDIATSGDLVVCLGAGNITSWAQALPAELLGLRDDRSAVKAGGGL